MPYILALDQGTTSSRAIVFDHDAAIVAVGQTRVQTDLPAAGLGRTRPERDLGDADRGGDRGARAGAPPAAGHRRHRHHQPARDDGRVGSRDRRTRLQRHRLAGPPDGGLLRSAEARRPRRPHPRTHRPGHRRLLFRQQGRVDSRQRPRGARAGRRPASWRSGPSTAGWCGSSRAAPRTSRTSATRRGRCCSTSTRCSGTTIC